MNKLGAPESILSRVAAKIESERLASEQAELIQKQADELAQLKKREKDAAVLREAKIHFDEDRRVKRALAHLDGTLARDIFGNPIDDSGDPGDPALAMNHYQAVGELPPPAKSERPAFYGFGVTSLTPKPVKVEPQEVDQRFTQLQENKKK